MHIIPPRHYMVVTNPVVRSQASGEVIVDALGQVKLAYADTEIRFSGDGQPFPLYPGEVASPVEPLKIVPAMQALRLKVITGEAFFPEGTFKSRKCKKMHSTIYFTTDYTEDSGVARIAGDEYLFEGPGTYMPRKEVSVVATENATVVYANEALKVFSLAELDMTGFFWTFFWLWRIVDLPEI